MCPDQVDAIIDAAAMLKWRILTEIVGLASGG